MVTVKGFAKRTANEGGEFVVMELMGGLELIQSSKTGKMYGTVRTTSVPVTFDERTAATLVGTKIPGEIVRVECQPYDFTVKATGEVLTLQHRFEYQPVSGTEAVVEQKMYAL